MDNGRKGDDNKRKTEIIKKMKPLEE